MKIYKTLVFISFLTLFGLGACSDDSQSDTSKCSSDEQCKGERVCVSGVCQTADTDQPNDMSSQPSDAGEEDDVSTPPEFDTGPLSDSGQADMGADLGCPEGVEVDPVTGQCVDPDCESEQDCPIDSYCDATTSDCTVLTCTMSEADCPASRPHLFPDTCLCGVCVGDSDCDAGKACDAGECVDLACMSTCDPEMQNSCASDQYCQRGCCVACVGIDDCPNGEVCEFGGCVTSPNCLQNPSVCPENSSCVAGACISDNVPRCDQGCPVDTLCGANNLCIPKGDPDCGECNSDCSCPNSLECRGASTGANCFGCSSTDSSKACPSGQYCVEQPIVDPFCTSGNN